MAKYTDDDAYTEVHNNMYSNNGSDTAWRDVSSTIVQVKMYWCIEPTGGTAFYKVLLFFFTQKSSLNLIYSVLVIEGNISID